MVVIVPLVELPPGTPFTVQVTCVLVVPVTLAVNCCWAEVSNVALGGEMLTAIVPTVAGVMVTLADANLVASKALVAVTVTTEGAGTVAGAVYRPVLETVPKVELPPCTPLTLQETALLG